jgi:hypothetical protein
MTYMSLCAALAAPEKGGLQGTDDDESALAGSIGHSLA